MSVSRIKTLAIAGLLLINAFFLAMIILDSAADARTEREALDNLCAILQSNGIIVSPGEIDANSSIRTVRTVRDDEAESMIASVILGETDMIDQGVIYLYENEERGVVEFASAGDFEIRLNPGVITSSGDALRTSQRLLSEMGIETSKFVSGLIPGGEAIKAVSTYRGLDIFNCSIEFIYIGESLGVVRGRYITGIESLEDSQPISSVSTALLGFLAAVMRGEHDCERIYSVEAGYHHRTTGAIGEGMLAPAWLLDTNTGTYIVDDTTGEVRVMG